MRGERRNKRIHEVKEDFVRGETRGISNKELGVRKRWTKIVGFFRRA
jgi:hypothetical protein